MFESRLSCLKKSHIGVVLQQTQRYSKTFRLITLVYKILLDYNSKWISEGESDKYILEPLYREILRLIVKLKNIKQCCLPSVNDRRSEKFFFVDLLNLLNSSLANLCKDYNVETSKGIFSYATCLPFGPWPLALGCEATLALNLGCGAAL